MRPHSDRIAHAMRPHELSMYQIMPFTPSPSLYLEI